LALDLPIVPRSGHQSLLADRHIEAQSARRPVTKSVHHVDRCLEVVASGVNHIDTSDFYGPHVTNQIIREALHPHPDDLVTLSSMMAAHPNVAFAQSASAKGPEAPDIHIPDLPIDTIKLKTREFR
jgi:hypothetical protein